MSPPLENHKVLFDVVNLWHEFPLHNHGLYAFNSLLCFNDRVFLNQLKLGWIALFIDYYFFFCDAVSSLSIWMFLGLDCELMSYCILNWDTSSSFFSLRMQKTEICVSRLMWVTAILFNKKLHIAIVFNSDVFFKVNLRWRLLFVKQ